MNSIIFVIVLVAFDVRVCYVGVVGVIGFVVVCLVAVFVPVLLVTRLFLL